MPTLATTVLPGWVLNAAYVIHSDEALLATGFIFLFHFFHTHLRPEAFPMDTVVFTGRMPLEAFKEERPLEYERLVAQGKLEENAGPGADRGEFRRRLHLRVHGPGDRHHAGGVHLPGAAGRFAALTGRGSGTRSSGSARSRRTQVLVERLRSPFRRHTASHSISKESGWLRAR